MGKAGRLVLQLPLASALVQTGCPSMDKVTVWPGLSLPQTTAGFPPWNTIWSPIREGSCNWAEAKEVVKKTPDNVRIIKRDEYILRATFKIVFSPSPRPLPQGEGEKAKKYTGCPLPGRERVRARGPLKLLSCNAVIHLG